MIGHAAARDALGRLVDRGDLRHAHAGDDPRRADRPRPDADLDRVGPASTRRLGPSAVATLPAITSMS